jgi:aspartate/methionine/tyrosine aminotransferase
MSDIKLQKVILGPDWIDLSFGEPVVITEALYRNLNRMGDPMQMPSFHDLCNWTYQPASGKPDLVKILEDKYDSKVVVANGAKQALGAALFAFKSAGYSDIWYDTPYYPANPSLIESVGLTRSEFGTASSLLVTSPNNPDGLNYSNQEIDCFSRKVPIIHDAAYYSPIYLPEGQEVKHLGNIQIFSASKMYGLSGLRIGYAVCHDERFYKDMVNYIEATTAGVSTLSQDVVRNIEILFKENPTWYQQFVKEARSRLLDSRKELLNLDPDVLEVIQPQSNSMFAWCKVGPKLDNTSAKVYMLPGEIFGRTGYMRLNIALPSDVIRKAVSRLNSNKRS